MQPGANNLRRLAPWAAAALVLACVVWWAAGPLLVSRTAEFTVSASGPGPATLEWLDAEGQPINGRWLDLRPGVSEQQFNESIPNYRFAAISLAGHGVTAKGPLVVRERLLFARFVHRAQAEQSGQGVVWRTSSLASRLTAANALDFALVFAVTLAGASLARLFLRGRSQARQPAQSSRLVYAALGIVILVHAYLACRAPMLYCPDSMDYAVNAQLILDHLSDGHSLDHFTAWRLPGYSTFLAPFMACINHFNTALGAAQGLLAIATAWLASRIISEHCGGGWAAITLLLIGLDPVLISWTRHTMPEALCALLLTLIAWATLQDRLWASRHLRTSFLAAAGLGVLVAALCYVRANYQPLIALAPLAAAAPLFRANRRRACILAATALATTAACLAPWLVRNQRRYERPQLVVGSGYTLAFSASEAGILDKNQSRLLTADDWQHVRADPQPGSFEFMDRLLTARGPIARQTASLPDWTKLNDRARAAGAESNARHPGERWSLSTHAFCNLLGLWPIHTADFQENEYWSRPLRAPADQGINHSAHPEDYHHLPAAITQQTYDRTLESTQPWSASPESKIFDAIYQFFTWLRPIFAALYLLGLALAIRTRSLSLACIGAFPLLHAAALAAVLLCGIDRYQAPLYPLTTALACYGVFVATSICRSGRHSRTHPQLG